MKFFVTLHKRKDEAGNFNTVSPIVLQTKPNTGDTIHYEDANTEEWWEVIHVTLTGDSPEDHYEDPIAGIVHVIPYDGIYISR